MTTPRFLAAGDTALTIELGDRAELGLCLRIQALHRKVMAAALPGVCEVVPALGSLTVHYNPCETSASRLRVALLPAVMDVAADGREPAEGSLNEVAPVTRRWSIPACYDPVCGPDIAAVAAACGLAAWQVTALHACVSYRVLMVGFLPGQPYLGDLPPPIQVPRRETPRANVPPGSIAIANAMCVVYPLASPGGWHIIGRTPVRLFDAERREPSLLAPGDEIRFRPVSPAELDILETAVARGEWALQPEEVPG
jgi:KipI family sensor histidine kinase inhibitor